MAASAPRAETLAAQLEGKLDLKLLPEPERRIIARAAALEPEGRFPNCMAFVKALEKTLQVEDRTDILRRACPSAPAGLVPDAGIAPVTGFKLMHLLGQGGIGQVWEAAGPGDVPAALKFIRLVKHSAVNAELRALGTDKAHPAPRPS